MISRVLIALVRGYQKVISPLLGHNCRFTPTCSQYMIQAIQVHGPAKGLLLGLWRILRCNPFGRPGLDPVPPKGKWRNDPPTPLRPGQAPAEDGGEREEGMGLRRFPHGHRNTRRIRTARPTSHKKTPGRRAE